MSKPPEPFIFNHFNMIHPVCNLYFQALHGHHQVVIPTVEMHQLHPSLDPNTTGYILVQPVVFGSKDGCN